MARVFKSGFLGAVAAALLLAGCASPQTRIDDHPDLFAKYTPEQQALIKDGKIAIGFDEDAVKLALGKPERITERTDANGKSVVWRYVDYETDTSTVLVSGFYPYAYAYSPFYYPFYNDVSTRRERDRIRVVFKDGKVVSVEQEVR